MPAAVGTDFPKDSEPLAIVKEDIPIVAPQIALHVGDPQVRERIPSHHAAGPAVTLHGERHSEAINHTANENGLTLAHALCCSSEVLRAVRSAINARHSVPSARANFTAVLTRAGFPASRRR